MVVIMVLNFRACKKCLLLSPTAFKVASCLLWFSASNDNSCLQHLPFCLQQCSLLTLESISPGKAAAGADAGAVHFLRLISHKRLCCALAAHTLSKLVSGGEPIKYNSMGLCDACLGHSVKAMERVE